jgi:hypothetical protein
MIPAWAAKYVGVPFEDHGHTITGWHCWGAVHAILKAEAGIETPTYAEISYKDIVKSSAAYNGAATAGDPWVEVQDPRVFDVALLKGAPMHVGIMVTSEDILHVWRRADTVLMPVTHPCIRGKLVGFFRHKALIK